MKTLRDVKIGKRAKVIKLHGEGALKRRIMDMGITRIVSFDECFRKIGRYEVISSA